MGIIVKYESTIKKLKKEMDKDKTVNGFIKASNEFEELVDKGYVKRRGYTLSTINDMHTLGISFNTSADDNIYQFNKV